MPLFQGVGFAGGLLAKSVSSGTIIRIFKSHHFDPREEQHHPIFRTKGGGFPSDSMANVTTQITQEMRKRHMDRNRLLSGDLGVPTTLRAVLLPTGPTKQVGKKVGQDKKKVKGNKANLLPIPTANRRLPTIVLPSSETKNHKISSGNLELMTKKKIFESVKPHYKSANSLLYDVSAAGSSLEGPSPGSCHPLTHYFRRWEGMAALAAAGMSDSGVNVDFGKDGARVDRFGSNARCDFVPLELEG
ncbi:hypothetical protein ACJ73_06089 [Blastomyces percursus]|uniref:Uncharacterized protein n=1 Tax=Blastomyces percursus TaxID=1658174 RepID=A0A1J9R246_9EURO|nr:hypothetical protein ACJ73_06089 [Blastomyces percursus]